MTNQASLGEIIINGVTYVPKDSVEEKRSKAMSCYGWEYCMVRTQSAGVFAGYVEKRNGMEATLRHARRIYYWEGAATLSQLAMDGTSKPEKCKFPCEVDSVTLTEVIEIIPITDKAQKSIMEVPVWKA